MDSFEKFKKTLPCKEDFYSSLNDEGISDKDYNHAKKIWEIFKMKTMCDYHDDYLKTDVLLLADVFEEFRKNSLKKYELDPVWYYTAPGLAWEVALKKSKVELDLLTDPNMRLLFERGMRGGVSTAMHSYEKANNKYMKDFDPEKPSKFLVYFDKNSLYSCGMCKPLPVGDFTWMDENELKNWENIVNKEGKGCVLEVDLEYPEELSDYHNDYPLAPETIILSKVEKLTPNLMYKEKKVFNGENLKLYLSLGMKLKKVWQGIKFTEKAWLKEYIEMNLKLRMNAENDFEKEFFKLMNNAVFGKTMENIRKRVDIQLVNNRERALILAVKSNFHHLTIFDENLIAIHMKRKKLVFDKPVYCGMCILDLSKILMYDFHYNYAKNKCKDLKVLYTDTDSFIYEVETDDFFADIADDVEKMFDTSNYPEDHPSCIPVGKNKKVIGLMKDEAGGKIIKEFVGLRSKLYSYVMDEGKEEKNARERKKCSEKEDYS